MVRKTLVFLTVLTITVMLVIPINADPTDVVLDQPVTLVIPARFALADQNNDQQPEAIQTRIQIRSYREGDFIVSGKLEAKRNEEWVEVATATQPFQWTTANNTAELIFQTHLIRQQQRSGPYRVSVSLRDGDWELPPQVVGFTPKYRWNSFARVGQK